MICIIGRKRLCPCCKKYKFEKPGKYEICPVCNWEDDPKQRKDPDYAGGANELSLKEYRRNYLERNK